MSEEFDDYGAFWGNMAQENPSFAELFGMGCSGPQASQGDTGNNVKDIQQHLISAGLLPPGEDDGIFGKKTATAVRSLQSAHGLPASGVVDDATWKVLCKQKTPLSAEEKEDKRARTAQTVGDIASITTGILGAIPGKKKKKGKKGGYQAPIAVDTGPDLMLVGAGAIGLLVVVGGIYLMTRD